MIDPFTPGRIEADRLNSSIRWITNSKGSVLCICSCQISHGYIRQKPNGDIVANSSQKRAHIIAADFQDAQNYVRPNYENLDLTPINKG